MSLVIGISGHLGAGKDAVASLLVDSYGFNIVRFSDALKEEVLARLPRTLWAIHEFTGHTHELSSCSYASRQDCIRDMVYNRKPKGVRELLQEYGSDLRRADDPAYWTDRWLERVDKDQDPVVAPDMRFHNEIEAVKKVGGWLWRVERPGLETNDHQSETALDDYPFDTVIVNDGGIAQLWVKVDKLMAESGQTHKVDI